MTPCSGARLSVLAFAAFAALGCASDSTSPAKAGEPAQLEALSTPATGIAGTVLATPLSVRVTDVQGKPVRGASVLFAVTLGNGSVSHAAVATDVQGHAETSFTVGTVAGQNEVSAMVHGITAPLRFPVVGISGAPARIALTPAPLRFLVGTDTMRLSAAAQDAFGNTAAVPPTFTVRDPSLISVDVSGLARALRRGGTSYIIVEAGQKTDSALVIVLAEGDSPCTASGTPRTLALGEVVTDLSGSGICVRAGSADEEYVLVPYFNSSVPSSTISIQAVGNGLGAFGPTAALASRSADLASPGTAVPDRAATFDRLLRETEKREMPRFAAGARAWESGNRRASRASTSAGGLRSTSAAAALPALGDLLQLNSNALEYCTNPRMRTGRVVAITEKAIVVADTGNPAGGFTDEEYRSIGVTFDTLVNAVDVGAFGEPGDVDQNARVLIFFTKAVNDLSPAGSGSIVLGFYWSRDLLPKKSTSGDCAGSNVAEMFYLLVPDASRSKSFVLSVTNGTVAHEYQHLINASRRLYVNQAAETDEETWLNEGLSHVAEELVFFRASGLQSRQNLDAAVTQNPAAAAFATFMKQNADRYRRYLLSTALQGPVGIDQSDDDLETRGAVWSFLRYAADRSGPTDGTFWYRLVNSQTSGAANLSQVLGSPLAPVLRDWAISVYADDATPGGAGDSRFSQPSWNFRSLYPAMSTTFPLTASSERRLTNGATASVTMRGGGVGFLRFVVGANSEALLGVTSGGQPIPASIQLAVVRLK